MKPKHSITTKTMNSAIYMDYTKCIGCNSCVRACDEQAVSVFIAAAERFQPPTIQMGSLEANTSCIKCG